MTAATDKERMIRIIPDDWVSQIELDAIFDMSRPLEVDVGCGKGGFLLSRAAENPDTNFLGIDRMLRRIRKVENKILRAELHNVRLFRVDASYAVAYMMPPNSVSVYYVFFPDPWPKKRQQGKRFFNDDFLAAIFRTLKPEGLIHVATDHIPYFEEIESLLSSHGGFAKETTFEPQDHERTEFERYYITHKPIGRCSFSRLPCDRLETRV